MSEIGAGQQPIDPATVARAKGLRVGIQGGFPSGIYGALYLDGGAFGIVVSRGCHGKGHHNFTLAHELGHFHIDGHAEAMFVGGATQVASQGGHFRDRRNPLEREADWFASELLMPERLAAPLVASQPPTPDLLRTVAADFEVSLCCAAIRYAELTDRAAAVMVSFKGRIEWIALSSRMREHKWSRRTWRRDSIPAGTATHRLVQSHTGVALSRSEADRPHLCTWFDGAPAAVTADEQAIGLGRYGRVLTVLSVPGLATPDEVAEEHQERNWRERNWRDALRGFQLD